MDSNQVPNYGHSWVKGQNVEVPQELPNCSRWLNCSTVEYDFATKKYPQGRMQATDINGNQ